MHIRATLIAVAAVSSLQAPAPLRGANQIFFDAAQKRVMLVNAYPGPDMPEGVQMRALGGEGWELVEVAAAPPMRRLAASVYDTRRQRLVLFGGVGSRTRGYEDLRGDTWEWDGTAWRDVTDPRVGTRDHHGMAFDAARGVTVLYGGVSSDRSRPMAEWVFPTETWTFDGARWMPIAGTGPNPGPRVGPAMAYDAASSRVVLFGGTGRTPDPLGDTWLWDGARWEAVPGAGGPGPRHGAAMALDPSSGHVLLFGGWSGRPRDEYFNDLWRWDGSRWIEIQTAERPDARSQGGLAYDAANRRMLLSGGGTVAGGQFQPADGLWAWDGARWTRVR